MKKVYCKDIYIYQTLHMKESTRLYYDHVYKHQIYTVHSDIGENQTLTMQNLLN